MEALFLKLVNMSITASWLVLAIIAVRLIFKKAPKWILCLLWGLVAVRLICPFSIESSLSLIPDAEPLSQQTSYSSETVKQANGDILDSEGNIILEQHPAANGDILDSEGNIIVEVRDGIRTYPEEEQTHSRMYFLSRIWLAGFGLMLAYTVVSYYLLKRKVSTAIPLKRGIKQSEYVDSPFVLGIIRPVIYLPFSMEEGDMAYVIAHEKAHIRRRDHWWKPFGFLLLSVYWFNPVLWVAYILLCRDIEAACDEKVIKDMEKDERRAYSTALLNCSIHRRRIAACPLAFGETGVKARVKSVMNYKKPAFWVILIALVVSIIVAVCFLTNPVNELPITMHLDYVSRTRADLKFVYDDSLAEGEFEVSENYELETWERDAWYSVGRPEVQASEPIHEVQSEDADYDSWSLLNFEEHYGRLGDGTYRIVKEVTIHNDSNGSEIHPIYAEFTIGGVADKYITYTLEDITPTGAKLYEHETIDEDAQLVYEGNEGFWLECNQDGIWEYFEPTEYTVLGIPGVKHYVKEKIYPSSHSELDWSFLYGELPDGTYRIARDVTYIAEGDLRVCTAYVEFTISSSPVTISLENARPTGATILFHQNQELINGPLLCNYEYFLQQQANGKWEDLPKKAEIPFPDQTYDIAVLHHNGVDWEQLYGRLPVGNYRLGKVIPITSGEHPEYTTVYAEFSVDNVYTWFDRYSTDVNERSPKDNVVALFGMEGVSLSYGSSINEILLVSATGNEPIISCDVLVDSAFLTDLTGDGIAEVCANVQTMQGTIVQVYDAAEKKLYELPTEANSFYVLTKKADRLCVLKNSMNWITMDYGQLSLNSGQGLEIRELDPEVKALTEKLVCIDIDTHKYTCLSTESRLENALKLLRDLKESASPASQREIADEQANTFDLSHISINYELGEKTITFSEDFEYVWEYGSKEGYRVSNPEAISQFVENVTDGVMNRETSGERFATPANPWDWCAGINNDAISTAEIFACLAVTSDGTGSSVSSTNGILPTETLQSLIEIINKIPKEAFSDSGKTEQDYRWFFHDQTEGNCSISMVDGVNQMAVAIRLRNGFVEMLLTDELDKALDSTGAYLNPAATIWTVRDPALSLFLENIQKNPPLIQYSIGAEYDWQDPMVFQKDGFSVNLRFIEGWEIERVENATNSGVRCRPAEITDGWVYFSYWPEDYTPKEEDRYIHETGNARWTIYVSYPSDVKTATSLMLKGREWSYRLYDFEVGDYVIINDGAGSWFTEYLDEIEDTISLSKFTIE